MATKHFLAILGFAICVAAAESSGFAQVTEKSEARASELAAPFNARKSNLDRQNRAFSEAARQNAFDNKEEKSLTSIFSHSSTSRFYVAGQINTIFQAHPAFRAKYSGENSFKSKSEAAAFSVLTLFTGVLLSKRTEILFNVESLIGKGISDSLGLAGFTNLDVVYFPRRNPKPYVARFMLRKIIPLGKETEEEERTPLSLATELPVRRLEIRGGKFGLTDFFDYNSVGSGSFQQFMNWTIDSNGAFDYAQEPRRYTYGALIEYYDKNWGMRFAEVLMPKTAGSRSLDLNLKRSGAENFEVFFNGNFLFGRQGIVRFLAFQNRGNMGKYREAIERFQAGIDDAPDVTAHPRETRRKIGFGINAEQEVSDSVRVFSRLGRNDDRFESFNYTEVGNTCQLGGDVAGTRWKRKTDKIGAAFATNGISRDHREYLALGGKGFILGDCGLNYGRENVFETYYNARLWRGVSAAFDAQFIGNPGYNRDRGPVFVPSLRLHLEF